MAQGGLLAVVAFCGLLLALHWRSTERRAVAFAFVTTLLLFLALRELPPLLPGERVLGHHWNWSGQLLAGAAVLLLAQRLVARAGFRWREFGLTRKQRPGSLRPALSVTAAVLAVNYLLMSLSSFRLGAVPAETWLYQATVPGLVEETVFRGVLLALADRLWTPRWTVGGAAIGVGGLAVTVLFVALHGLSLHTLTGVLPAALLYLWLRARTGTLVAPILAHNTWNLSVYAAHL